MAAKNVAGNHDDDGGDYGVEDFVGVKNGVVKKGSLSECPSY
jgi:hypothetical protein